MEHHSSSVKAPFSLQVIEFSDLDDDFDSPHSNFKMGNTFHSQSVLEDPLLNSTEDEEILLIGNSNNTLSFNQDQFIGQIMNTQKMRFVVKLCSCNPNNQRITFKQKPVFSDNENCKYYLLKCYVSSESSALSFYILRFGYSIALYFHLDPNEKIVSFLKTGLKNLKPSVWKTNNLIIHNNIEDYSGLQYATTSLSIGHLSRVSSKHDNSTHASKTPQKQARNRMEGSKYNMFNHFTNIHPSNCKIVYLINNLKVKGLFYNFSDLITLLEKITTSTFLTSEFECEILKNNMKQKVEECKKQYTSLSNSIFNAGKSQEFAKLRIVLTENYNVIMDSFDLLFRPYQSLEDYEIHLQILRGWIQKQEQNLFQTNSILRETQTSKHLQSYLNVSKKKDIVQAIDLFFQTDLSHNSLNLDAFMLFLKQPYLNSLKTKIDVIEQNNKRRIVREINYYENPAEMLKNCDARLTLCNDKKEYLLKCISLVNMEIENLDNLQSGLVLEENRESSLIAMNKKKHENTLDHK